MHLTLVLLFLSWFFNVNVLLVSSSNPSGQNSTPRKRSHYDIFAQPHALIKWDPRIDESRYSRPYSVLRSLSVKVEGPATMTSVNKLRLTTIITNTGRKRLMLVNEPSGALYSRHPTERFYVTHSTGKILQFRGVQVEFSLKEAIESGDVTTILPGQSIVVTHRHFSEAYDFSTGFGHYNFKPKNIFFVVNPVTKRVTMVQAGTTHGTSVEWSGQLVARGDNDLTFDGCSDDQQNSLRTTNDEIVKDATGAQEYLATQQVDREPNWERYILWFGELDADRQTKVTNILKGILDFAKKAQYDCKPDCNTDTIAKGHFNIVSNRVSVCPNFFNLQEGDERVLALIFGLSHHNSFTAKLHRNAVGEAACKTLAKTNPEEAVKNADSYGYFILDGQRTSTSEER